MADALAVTLHELGEETTAGTGESVDVVVTRRTVVALTLRVVAATGSGSVTLQTSADGLVGWRTVATFGHLTGIAVQSKTVEIDQFIRATWAPGTSLTFLLEGQAHVLYASPADLSKTCISLQALTSIEPEVLLACCLRATADGETALNSSNEMPITAWGEDLRGHVAARAVWYAINQRGRKPQSGLDSLIDISGGFLLTNGTASAAESYFRNVAAGAYKPVGVVDQTPDDFEGGGVVVSGPSRGCL